MLRIKAIIKGIIRYLPGQSSLEGTGGTISARYCYSVWLRHLTILHELGLNTQTNVIAELGPGDSIGIGLAALFSCSKKYYALDVVDRFNCKRNLQIFNKIIDLFSNREDIPNDDEFPMMAPRLKSYKFPCDVLTEEWFSNWFNEKRINLIRDNLLNLSQIRQEESLIRYICPWNNSQDLNSESIDMIFSQAVLEHVEDLEGTYKAIFRLLKKGGMMSHQIDFKNHGVSDVWNGQWSYSDFVWKLIKSNRPYLINREPLSTHIDLLKSCRFKIVCILPERNTKGINRSQLAKRFKFISDEDLITSSAYIIPNLLHGPFPCS